MINKITKKQEAQIPVWIDRYLNMVKEPINKEIASRAIENMYTSIGEEKPIIIYGESPLNTVLINLLFYILTGEKKENLGSQLRPQLDSQLRSQLYSQLGSQIGSRISSQLGSQLDSQLSSQLYSQLDSQLRSRIGSQLGSQLDSQLDSQLRSQLRPQLSSQLDSQLRSQLDSQLRSQLDSQLRPQLSSQFYSQLGSQIGSQFDSQLGSQLGSQLKNINYNWFLCLWWKVWSAWFSYGRYIGVKFDNDKYKLFTEFVDNVNFIIPYKGIVFVSENPTDIHWNNRGLLHKTDDMAVKFADGYGLYSIDGIGFEPEFGKKLTSGKASFDEILKLRDVDQRNKAMLLVGDKERDKFLKHVKAEVIHEYKKLSPKGKIVYYKLYKIPKGDIFNTDIKAMWYTCPSTGMSNFSGVPFEIKTVPEAMSWKGSNEFSKISPEDWEKMTPLVDES